MSDAEPQVRQHLDRFLAEVGKHPPRLGCSMVSHRDLGFCCSCREAALGEEVAAWRLLAMAERGMVDWTKDEVPA